MAVPDTKKREPDVAGRAIIFPGKELFLPVTHGQGNVKVGIHIPGRWQTSAQEILLQYCFIVTVPGCEDEHCLSDRYNKYPLGVW